MAIRIIVCDDYVSFRGFVVALAQNTTLDVIGEVPARGRVGPPRPTGADLVLLDVELPDGAVAAVAEVTGETSVVMTSANDHADLVRRALRDGALGYIQKDAEPGRSASSVGRLRAGQR